MSIELEDVPSGYNLSKINNNFQTIENYVNTSLLHRAETTIAGEAKMERDLDMDSHRILNADIDASSITNDRALRVPTSEGFIKPLPVASERANKVLVFDEDGLPSVAFPFPDSALDVRMDLANTGDVSKGDALIGVKYPTSNSLSTTQHEVNARRVSIIDFGGKPDGVTPTNTAIAKIKTDIGSGVIVEFPKIGTSSVYYWSNTYDPSITAGLIFDCAPGVSFDLPDVAYIDSTVRFVKDTPANLWALGNCDFVYPKDSKDFGQARPIWNIEPDTSSLYPINPSITGAQAPLEYIQFDQNNDVQTTIVPSATTVNSVTFNNGNNSLGQYGLTGLAAGEEISVLFSATAGANATYSGMVVTGNSRYWFICGVTNTGQVFVQAKVNGVALTGAALNYEGQTTHDSYRLASSLVTLRKDSNNHFSLLLNGYSVWETDTTSPIVKMGFGGVGGTGSITVSDWVHRRYTPVDKGKFISVSVFGDSITDPNVYGAWPSIMQNILDSNNGIRIINTFNYAVSGATAGAQLPFVNPTNLSKSNVALVLLGVNDIQGSIPVSTYIANINAIIDTCRNNANTPIIGLPTMFYSQGQTNPTSGQATVNYSAGAPYRSAVMRLCSEKGVKFVDLGPVLGPVLGNWNNTNLGIPFGDPIVFDNIHPTSNARYLIARAFASAVLGLYVTDRDDSYGGFLPSNALLNSWTFNSGAIGYEVDSKGKVSFYNSFRQPTTSPIPDATQIYVLPQNLRPISSVIIPVANEFTSCRITIGTDGVIRVYGMTGGLTLSMDGVSLHTRRRIKNT